MNLTPNNREWAILIIVGVVFVAALLMKPARRGVADVARQFLNWKIFVPFLGLAAWTVLLAWLGSMTPLWDGDLAVDTVIFFFTAAVGLLFKMGEARSHPNFFRRRLAAVLSILLVLEVLLDLFVLSIPAEVVLQVVLGLTVMLAAVAQSDPTLHQVHKLLNGVLGLAGLTLATLAIIQLVTNWSETDKGNLLQEIALPVWMTAGLLPYVYLLGLWSAYELAFMRLGWQSDEGATRRTKWERRAAVLFTFNIRARKLGSLNGRWEYGVGHADSFRDARGQIRRARSAENERIAEEAEAANRLIRDAGLEGTDDDGRQLDQREFKETQDALRRLLFAQMGWYRNQGKRYLRKVLDVQDFERDGLPTEHGITMHIARDGQSWWAWRRTVTGWCLGVGASDEPPDEWMYDGSDPPTGPPGEELGWSKHGLDSPNW